LFRRSVTSSRSEFGVSIPLITINFLFSSVCSSSSSNPPPLLAGVRDELMGRVAGRGIPETIDLVFNGQAQYGVDEEESAALGYVFLKRFAEVTETSLTTSTVLVA